MFEPKSRITFNWKILIAIVALSVLGFTIADLTGLEGNQPADRVEVLAETIELEVAPFKGSIAPDFKLQTWMVRRFS